MAKLEKRIIIPDRCKKDLVEIPANIVERLEIIPVEHVDEVLARALAEPVEPIEWSEEEDLASQPTGLAAGGLSPTAH